MTPEFRLPKAIVANEVKKLEAMGVHVMTDMVIGKVLSIDELFEEMGFKAVFVGSGAGLPMFMHIEGEALKGVMSANEYLTRINLMKGYRDESDTPVIRSNAVAVVGGGNVAMDAARCAKRLGAEHVYIVYRRGEAEMPARLEELHHAKEEGIELHVLCNPTKILDDGNGRVGRTLLNYWLMINDYPPMIIYEEDRRAYYDALQAYDEREDLEPLTLFLQQETVRTWERTMGLDSQITPQRKGLDFFMQ